MQDRSTTQDRRHRGLSSLEIDCLGFHLRAHTAGEFRIGLKGEPLILTGISRGAERWFEHVFVSDCFRVTACGYLHLFRENGFSDHSAVIAALSYASG